MVSIAIFSTGTFQAQNRTVWRVWWLMFSSIGKCLLWVIHDNFCWYWHLSHLRTAFTIPSHFFTPLFSQSFSPTGKWQRNRNTSPKNRNVCRVPQTPSSSFPVLLMNLPQLRLGAGGTRKMKTAWFLRRGGTCMVYERDNDLYKSKLQFPSLRKMMPFCFHSRKKYSFV